MNTEDIKGFFASREQLEMADYLTLDYYLVVPLRSISFLKLFVIKSKGKNFPVV